MKYLLLFLLVGVIGCNNSKSPSNSDNSSDKEPDVKEAINYIDNFFKIYKDDGSDKALDYLSQTNGIKFNSSQIINIKNKLDSAKIVLGSFNGYEQITKKYAGNSLVLISYLVKHEIHPIRFTFVFYKPKDHWLIHNFNYDSDELLDELQQSGKVYFLK